MGVGEEIEATQKVVEKVGEKGYKRQWERFKEGSSDMSSSKDTFLFINNLSAFSSVTGSSPLSILISLIVLIPFITSFLCDSNSSS